MLKCLFFHYPVRAWFPVYVYGKSRKDMTQMPGSFRYHVLYTISRSVHVLYDPYRYHVHNINSERFIMINTFMI